MATIENRATADGDVLLIRAEAPIIGLIYLTDFIDSTTGEDASTFFRKEYRYATDGINFKPWQPLTAASLAAIQVRSSDTFLIEYRYTRVGGGAGELSFSEIDVHGKIAPRECGPVYKQSIFADYFSCSDTEVLGWAINVTEKIYRRGLMPSFVERAATSNNLLDRDYLDFWRSVAQFFAFIVIYTRQLERIHQRPELLREYLSQWGLFGTTGQSLDKLVYLLENQRDQFRQRGTAGIVALGSAGEPEGELLRLLGHVPGDEFLLNSVAPVNAAWCMGHNAPTYRGVGSQAQLNKLSPEATAFTETANVSPSLTYEIAFSFLAPAGAKLDFGCLAYDQYGTPVPLLSMVSGRPESWFFQQVAPHGNLVEYQVRGLVFHYNQLNRAPQDCQLRFGAGYHLRMTKAVRQLRPQVFTSGGEVKLFNLRLAPASAPHSLGFVDSGRFVQAWAQNRNDELTENQLTYRIKHFLLPYNASFLPVYIPAVPAVTL
jgi:hypothetical protein